MIITLAVQYTCLLCGIRDAVVQVPARRSEAEDLKAWMDATIVLISAHHRRRSPTCHPRTLTNMKIPIDGVAYVGGPPVQ